MSTLKSCPFCGEMPVMKVSSSIEQASRKIECLNCGVRTGWEDEPHEPLRTWNKREMSKKDLLAVIPTCKTCDSWSTKDAWVNKKKYCSANQAYFKEDGSCSDHTYFEEVEE